MLLSVAIFFYLPNEFYVIVSLYHNSSSPSTPRLKKPGSVLIPSFDVGSRGGAGLLTPSSAPVMCFRTTLGARPRRPHQLQCNRSGLGAAQKAALGLGGDGEQTTRASSGAKMCPQRPASCVTPVWPRRQLPNGPDFHGFEFMWGWYPP